MLEIYSSSIWSMLLLFQNVLTSFIMYHPHCLGPYFFSLRISGLKLGIFSLKWVFLTNLSRFELSKNKGKLHWAVGRQVQCRRNISWKVNTRLVFSQRKRCTQEKCLNNMQRTIYPMSIKLIQNISAHCLQFYILYWTKVTPSLTLSVLNRLTTLSRLKLRQMPDFTKDCTTSCNPICRKRGGLGIYHPFFEAN